MLLSKSKVDVVTKVQRDYETTVHLSSLHKTQHYPVLSPTYYTPPRNKIDWNYCCNQLVPAKPAAPPGANVT